MWTVCNFGANQIEIAQKNNIICLNFEDKRINTMIKNVGDLIDFLEKTEWKANIIFF